MGLAWVTFFFVICGSCDQRRVRMMVTGLEGVAGFSVGLGMKNSWVKRVYTDYRDWFGLVQDLMG